VRTPRPGPPPNTKANKKGGTEKMGAYAPPPPETLPVFGKYSNDSSKTEELCGSGNMARSTDLLSRPEPTSG